MQPPELRSDMRDGSFRRQSVLFDRWDGLTPDAQTLQSLLLASGLLLFFELAFIRWLGANVVHLSYFSNFVLLGSFLGIGLGLLPALSAGRPWRCPPLCSPRSWQSSSCYLFG